MMKFDIKIKKSGFSNFYYWEVITVDTVIDGKYNLVYSGSAVNEATARSEAERHAKYMAEHLDEILAGYNKVEHNYTMVVG